LMKKIILPVFTALLIIGAAQYFNNEGTCSDGILPLAFLLSPLGCSESKEPDSTTTALNAIDHAPASVTVADRKPGNVEHKVTFVEIGSVNCIPCKMMQPIMRDIEREYDGQVTVVFHDVWTPQGKQQAMKYGVQVIPTQVFLYRDGKEYYRHIGFFPKDELVKILKMKGVN
jgi:thiol-disulfide isomerase/thioredoxin